MLFLTPLIVFFLLNQLLVLQKLDCLLNVKNLMQPVVYKIFEEMLFFLSNVTLHMASGI